jgi:hypothetical protein
MVDTYDLIVANSSGPTFGDTPECVYQLGDGTGAPGIADIAIPCLPEDLMVGVVDWQEGYTTDRRKPSFVQYTLEVAAMGQKWVLHKRYREFSALHKQLQKICPNGGGLPSLPRKHAKSLSSSLSLSSSGGNRSSSSRRSRTSLIDGMLSAGSKWDETFLEQRREALDCYIKALTFIAVAQPDMLGPAVICFLDPDVINNNNNDNNDSSTQVQVPQA